MKLKDFFSNCSWKIKAIKRAHELNSLRKRIKELVISRDKSKNNNAKLKVQIKELEDKIKELDYELKKN